jgi:micrococcal nuclease
MTLQNLRVYMGLSLVAIGLQGFTMPAEARIYTGVVTQVTDGDTFWVRTSVHGEPRKVRFQGIDAPESCQAWGAQATAALTQHVQFKTVQLNTRARDDYGRMLAIVTLDGDDVGRWMVENGNAWSYHYRRSLGPYAAEETRARAAGRGLWSQAAIEPRDFRKLHGACPHPRGASRPHRMRH